MIEKLVTGYTFEQEKTYTVAQLQKMAIDCGDSNFIHHDMVQAKQSRFNEIIASGSAISAIFSAMIPAHISAMTPMLGLEMSFKFPSPIRPNTPIKMSWEISDTRTKTDATVVVTLNGIILDANNQTLVTAKAKIMLLPSF
tara:strand:+ start:2469 stop:2891 length:423 start_codon:yes stop_codon:yes gene_type:complete